VLGDEGIHARVGDEFWQAVAARMAARFRVHDWTGGLVDGIQEIGERLATHFRAPPTTGTSCRTRSTSANHS